MFTLDATKQHNMQFS